MELQLGQVCLQIHLEIDLELYLSYNFIMKKSLNKLLKEQVRYLGLRLIVKRQVNLQEEVEAHLELLIDYLKELLKKNFITKVKWIVPGGSTGQESICNGLKAIYADCPDPKDSVVLIHDGVRPLISEQLIKDNIECVRKYGTAITVVPQNETVVSINDDNEIVSTTERSTARIARAPQSFILEDIMECHRKAIAEGRNNMIDSASMMTEYGHKLHVVEGPIENIKITTPSDYYIFRAIFEARENSQIFGF